MAKSTLPVNFKDDVLAASMGGKRRYRLIHNSDGTVSLEDTTTYTQVGSNFGAAQVNATNAAVNASLATDGNASNVINSFSQASERSNLSTGEKLSVSLGKIVKWFADLRDSAFRSVANNLSTSSSGSSVLDAYQGYLLNNSKVNTSNVIDSLSDVVANTQSKKPAGSLALKELNGKLGYTANVTTVTLNGWTVQWQNAGAGYIYVRLTRTVRKLEGGSAYTEITNLPFTVAFSQCIPITNIVATTVVGSGIANFFGTTLICRYQPYGNEVSNVITGLLRVV